MTASRILAASAVVLAAVVAPPLGPGSPATPAEAATGGAVVAPAAAPAAVAAPAGPISSDWPQFGFGPAHHGLNPREHTLRGDNLDRLRRQRGVPIASVAEVTTRGRLIFAAAGQQLHAFDRDTGRMAWSRSNITTPVPAVTGDLVLAGTSEGVLLALDAASGRVRWRERIANGARLITPPTVAGGLVFVGTLDNRMYAVDLASHGIRWTAELDSAPLATSAAVAGGSAYFGSAGGTLYAVEVSSGQERWHVPVADGQYLAPPVAAGPCVLVSARAMVHCFAVRDGFETWSRGGGTQLVTQPVVLGSQVVWTQGRHVYLTDVRTGDTTSAFTSPHPAPLGPLTLTGARVGDTVVYTVQGRHLLAVWLRDPRSILVADLRAARPQSVRFAVVADGRVYVSGGPTLEIYALGRGSSRLPAERRPRHT